MVISLWTLISSSAVLDTPYFKAIKDNYQLPDGHQKDFYYAELPNWVAIAAFTPTNQLILVKQYRYAVKEQLLELPAGIVDRGEDPIETAGRELLEETGYNAVELEQLGSFYPAAGKVNQTCTVYFARVSDNKEPQQLDEDESLEVVLVPATDAMQMILDGKIKSLATITGILMAKELYPGIFG